MTTASTPPGLDPAFRATLFADVPLAAWGSDQSSSAPAPWDAFARAREDLAEGRESEAIAAWRQVIATPGLESRHSLQAWTFLRSRKVQPPTADAKTCLGVVVEAALDEGLDIVAAYANLSARFIHNSGGSIIWEHPDTSLDPLVASLLAAGQTVVNHIGPWEGERPAPPARGRVRLNFLAPSGLHFGEGPMEVFQKDPLAGPVVSAAVRLMSALIDLSNKAR